MDMINRFLYVVFIIILILTSLTIIIPVMVWIFTGELPDDIRRHVERELNI